MKYLTTASAIAAAALTATASHGAIIAFEAESGVLGSNLTTVDGGGASGSYIEAITSNGGDNPATAGQVATYTVNLAAATTYDLYARYYIDSGDGNGSNDDSFFAAADFGTAALDAASWYQVNNLSPDQPPAYTNPDGDTIGDDEWNWLKISNNVTTPESAGDYTTTTAGAYTFQIGNREDGLRIDALAFVTQGDTPSEADLDTALIPEPGSLALLGLGGLLMLGGSRRRG